MRSTIALVAFFALAGCASASHSCVTVKNLSPQEQSALAHALANVPANSPIIAAMGDYKRMRDESRVCQLIAQ